MKIISARIAEKSIKGIFPYEFTYEDGTKGIYLPENMMQYEERTITAQEAYALVAQKDIPA